MLRVTGPEATNKCQGDQICAVLKAVIDWATHRFQTIWDEDLSTEDLWLLLVDAKNAFNEGNRNGILWTIHHSWPSGAHFVFNCYRHWSLVVLWNRNGAVSFLHSRKVLTNGYPLDMLAYGIWVLLLIKQLKAAYPDSTQTWYAQNAGALGKLDNIGIYFNLLKSIDPGRGYKYQTFEKRSDCAPG